MQRRAHKKSRYGCRQCKVRHLRCDETPERCLNCVKANMVCSFITSTSRPISTRKSPPHTEVEIDAEPVLDTLHLRLLHNWLSSLGTTASSVTPGSRIFADKCFEYGLRYPFLLWQALALSALHLTVTKKQDFRQQGMSLQSHALRHYRNMLSDLKPDTAPAVLLAAPLFGIYAFAEHFHFYANEQTLDGLIQSMNLFRGTRTLFAEFSEVLMKSDLVELIEDGTRLAAPLYDSKSTRFDHLREVCTGERMTSAITAIEGIVEIQEQHEADGKEYITSLVTNWMLVVEAEYVQALQELHPHALLILAHYCIPLHRAREHWAIRNASQILLRYISEELGDGWRNELEIPWKIVFPEEVNKLSES